MKTVTRSTTSGWRAARTDAPATLVNFTALNQLKKCPKRKAPETKHHIISFFSTDLSSCLSDFLLNIGMAKNGSAMVSLQKPMAIDGAVISFPKIPDIAPKITPKMVAILAYFAIKLLIFQLP